MFSRSTHKRVDILLERKCAAISENNGSCLFVCKTTVVLIPNPDSMLHWSCSYSLNQHKPLLLDPFFKLRPKLKNNSGSVLYTSVWKKWCSSWAEVQQEMKLTFFLQHPRIAGEEALSICHEYWWVRNTPFGKQRGAVNSLQSNKWPSKYVVCVCVCFDCRVDRAAKV